MIIYHIIDHLLSLSVRVTAVPVNIINTFIILYKAYCARNLR